MGTIDGRKLKDALAKAKNIGLVEETFLIEDCELVLRSLRPDEYAASHQDCQGLDGIAYLNAFQFGHLSRSIVKVNGVDFRDVDFVTVEEPDSKSGQLKNVKLERHAYLLKYLLSSWGKEAIYTAYRKFGDVIEQAERKAKEGITFLIPEETGEERYRRLLLEAKSAEGDVPDTMVDRILEDVGLMRKATSDELRAATERTDQLAREQEAAKEAAQPPEPEAAEPAPVLEVSEAVQPAPAEAVEAVPAPQAPVRRVVDPHQTLQQAIASRQAAAPVPVPATPVVQADQSDGNSGNRTSAIAALEADLPSSLPGNQGQIEVQAQRPETVELRERQQRFDATAASAILDRPPTSGINPRFRPPTKI